MKPELHRTSTGEIALGIEHDLSDLAPWPATVAGVRDCVLRHHVTAMDLGVGPDFAPESRLFMPTSREVETVSACMHEAVVAGRVIDFGDLPNAVIKQGGNRGGPLWNQGALPQPFSAPWVLYHTWEGHAAVYLVMPVDDGAVEICELVPYQAGVEQVLTISDRCLLESHDEAAMPQKYYATVAPCPMRFVLGEMGARVNDGMAPAGAAAANVLDPLMTALLILNTRNVERTTIRPSAKLNKARAKSGKPAIPPYDRVNTAPYVTAILARRSPYSGDRGGTHASPRPHIRRAHVRAYADGKRTFIRDTLVAVTSGARAEFLRSHYTAYPSR